MEHLPAEQVAEAMNLVIDAPLSRAKLPRLTVAEFAALTALNTTAQLLSLIDVSSRINELLWQDIKAVQAQRVFEPDKTTGYLIGRGCQGIGG
jgi:hypothetical protein